ncbi:hypothetical protein BK025_05020 [Sodalis sp. TME1]|nr:hypothetical protein BK025_05020 [Sodalis sp. TME1]
MDYANPSKPDTHEINRVETDLLLAMSALTQRGFSKLAGWNESKVSRYNLRDMATAMVILGQAWAVSPIAQIAKQAVAAVLAPKENAPGTEMLEA